jgi:hypothetical protein
MFGEVTGAVIAMAFLSIGGMVASFWVGLALSQRNMVDRAVHDGVLDTLAYEKAAHKTTKAALEAYKHNCKEISGMLAHANKRLECYDRERNGSKEKTL